MYKKIVAFILTLVLICTSCIAIFYTYAQDKKVDANILMLDNIIENKPWIIESLAYGDFSNNPFTLAIPSASETSLMNEVLTNYKNDTAFKYLVDGMEVYGNTGTYVQSGIDELWAAFSSKIGILTDEELIRFVDKSIKSVDELKYDSILNDVLLTNYTSSWNSTLFESNSTLEQYRQRAKILNSLSKYKDSLLANSELLSTGYFETAKSFTEYTDKFIDAYEDNLYTALTTAPFLSKCKDTLTSNEVVTKYITNAVAMSIVTIAEIEGPKYRESKRDSFTMSEIYSDCFAPGINAILKSAGKVIEFEEIATKYAMLLEALVDQNDSTVQVLNRICSATSDRKLENVISYYNDLVIDQKNTSALRWDIIVDALSKKGYIGKYVTKNAWKQFDNYMTLKTGYYDLDLNVMTNATSQNLIKLGKCVSLGVWLGNKATSIEDTSKEIYVCKYTDKLLKETLKAYKADYEAYTKNKSDENAKKCIDDLEFMKKLRLYGEQHAYASMSSQTDSVIGTLLGGSDASKFLGKRYQAQVDSLLGCTILPQSISEFNVGEDEELIFMPDVLSNGKITLEAIYKKSDKSMIVIPEADTVLMSRINVDNATVKLLSADSNDLAMFVNSLNFKGDCNLDIYGSSFAVGNLKNSTGQLNINLAKESSKLTVVGSASNSGTFAVSGSGKIIEIFTLSNSGTVSSNSTYINITGNLINSGTINSSVVFTANGKSAYCSDSYSEIPTPSISGNGTISSLSFDSNYKKGVAINGKQNITGYLSTGNTRLKTSENLIVTGPCVIGGNVIKGNITLRDYTTNSAINIKGDLYIENDVILNHDINFGGGLYLTSNCKTLTVNKALNIKGDMEYKAGTIIGTDWLKLHGDLNISASSSNISKLEFIGYLPQNVKSSYVLNVAQLSNNNKSLQGVTFNSVVNVSEILTTGSTSAYINGKNVCLTGNAKLVGNMIKGSISAKNWKMTDSLTVTETFYTSGTINISENLALNTDSYNQSDGTLTMDKCSTIECKNFINHGNLQKSEASLIKCESFINYGNLKKSKESLINCENDFYLGGTGEDEGSITVGGDCMIKDWFSGNSLICHADLSTASLELDTLTFKSKLPQLFTSSSTAKVKNLNIDNVPSNGFFGVGVSFNSQITVTDAFICEGSSVYTNGKNVILTGNAVLNKNEIIGDLTSKDWVVVESLKVKGTFSASGSMTLNENVKIVTTNYNQSNGSLKMSDGCSIECENFTNSGSLTTGENTLIDCDKEFYLGGSGTGKAVLTVGSDCILKDSFKGKKIYCHADLISRSVIVDELVFESKAPQFVETSGTTTDDLYVDNTSKNGLTINGTIAVKKNVNVNNSNIVNSSNIKLLADNILISDTYGDMNLSGTLTFAKDTTINGYMNLSSNANLTVGENVTVTVKKFVSSSSSTITIKEGGKLIIESYLSSSSDKITVAGEISVGTDMIITSSVLDSSGMVDVKGDAKISSSTVSASGLLTFLGDLTVSSGTWKYPNLSFVGKTPQVISGTSLNAGNLLINNQCKTGITFTSKLIYSGNINKNSSVINGENNLTVKS